MEMIQKYRDTYYKMSSFDSMLKSIGSYKLDELIELCKQLNIPIDNINNNTNNNTNNNNNNNNKNKKPTKKDIYELLVLHY